MEYPFVLMATIRYYDPDPFSGFILMTLGVCTAIAFFLSSRHARHSATRQWFAVVASLVAIMYVLLLGVSRYPDFDGFIAMAACLAFGFGYCLSAMRGPSFSAGMYATILSAIYLYCIGLGFVTHLNTVLSEYEPVPVIGDDLKYLTPALPVIPWWTYCCWLVPGYLQQSKQALNLAKGLCVSCGYNLKGSKESNCCPECGHAIDWDEMTIAQSPVTND